MRGYNKQTMPVQGAALGLNWQAASTKVVELRILSGSGMTRECFIFRKQNKIDGVV